MNYKLYDSKQLNFVEFNITGDNTNHIRCDKESKFLDTAVFNLFTRCFEQSNKLYDYFEPTKYNPRSIVILQNQLKENQGRLNTMGSIQEFIDYVNSHSMGFEFIEQLEEENKNWKDHWEKIRKNILKINIELISLVEQCIDEGRVLWIIGY